MGYRRTLPTGYRRSVAHILTGQVEVLGVDLYTTQTERNALEACQRDGSEIPLRGPDQDPDVRVGVYRNAGRVSALVWATTARVAGAQPLSTHHKVESFDLGGWEAVRLIEDNVNAYTTAFVIRANDRIYEVGAEFSAPPRLPKTWLDDVARTFVVLAPSAFPSPTATVPPLTAARTLGRALAEAFAARDADAVARLMPDCWLSTWPLVDGVPPGGVLNRSVALFTQGLRERFAAGDLTVTVEPSLQTQTWYGEEVMFVRSDWTEPDRSTRIDLFLSNRDGQWRWRQAVHHYTLAQMQAQSVWFCRSPWITGPNRC